MHRRHGLGTWKQQQYFWRQELIWERSQRMEAQPCGTHSIRASRQWWNCYWLTSQAGVGNLALACTNAERTYRPAVLSQVHTCLHECRVRIRACSDVLELQVLSVLRC